LFLFHLYCRLGGEPTGEPTRDDLIVDKAGTKTSYYSSGGALVASRRPPLQRLAVVGCCILHHKTNKLIYRIKILLRNLYWISDAFFYFCKSFMFLETI